MYPYKPRPWHLIVPLLFFLFGAYAFTWNTPQWDMIAWSSIILGWIGTGIIAIVSIWDKVIEHNDSKRNLIDTARHLDLDRLAAIGFIAEPIKETVNVRIAHEDRHGIMERQVNTEFPISPVKLQVLANHILNGVPFTRREWVDTRKHLTDGEYRNLLDAFKANGIVTPKDPNKPTLGYDFTSAGRAFLRSVSTVPSPTPTMDMLENGL